MIRRLITFTSVVSLRLLLACTAGEVDLGGTSSKSDGAGGDGPDTTNGDASNALGDSGCSPSLANVQVRQGEGFIPPSGDYVLLTFAYKGSEVAIRSLVGLQGIDSPSNGPFEHGKFSGHWAEIQDSSGKTLFTRTFQDPTRLEIPGGGPTDAAFTNETIAFCTEKTFEARMPFTEQAATLVLYGSDYGTQGVATEFARFLVRLPVE